MKKYLQHPIGQGKKKIMYGLILYLKVNEIMKSCKSL